MSQSHSLSWIIIDTSNAQLQGQRSKGQAQGKKKETVPTENLKNLLKTNEL